MQQGAQYDPRSVWLLFVSDQPILRGAALLLAVVEVVLLAGVRFEVLAVCCGGGSAPKASMCSATSLPAVCAAPMSFQVVLFAQAAAECGHGVQPAGRLCWFAV